MMYHHTIPTLSILCAGAVLADSTIPTDIGDVCVSLVNRQHQLMLSIHDTASADAAAAELKALGELMYGLLSDTSSLHLTAEQTQIINTRTAEIPAYYEQIKSKQYYGSRLLIATYNSMQLATLPAPTEAEISAATERIKKEYETLSNILPTIVDRASADAAALKFLTFNKSVNLAWDADLIPEAQLQELMQPKPPTAADINHIKRLQAADFYGSHLLRMSLGK